MTRNRVECGQVQRDWVPYVELLDIATQIPDVRGFGFVSLGALEFTNEYTGLPVAPAHLF